MATGINETCPICLECSSQQSPIPVHVEPSTQNPVSISYDPHVPVLIECKICGSFAATRDDINALTSSKALNSEDRLRLSILIRERTTYQGASRPLPLFWIRDQVGSTVPPISGDYAPMSPKELLQSWPDSVAQILDRVLCNISRMQANVGDVFVLVHQNKGHERILFSGGGADWSFYTSALTERGYLEMRKGAITEMPFRLTAKGWDRVEHISRASASPENPVFVAMWYGDTADKAATDNTPAAMLGLYRDTISTAIKDAGYKAIRADQAEFNDGIMDKVLGDIRAAPFVVADYTGNRNGVYYEAGFARGLGKTVIQTCRESDLKDLHFDIKNLNIIVWNAEDELRRRLRDRIRATLGDGPFKEAR